MKVNLKSILITSFFAGGMLFSTNADAQTSCSKDGTVALCCSTSKTSSGCSPSACRGAKTKFGEAKVITDLRSGLIALKADMEKSKEPSFDPGSYDVRGIVGETDDESLDIISKEVRIVEKAFSEKLNYNTSDFIFPKSKAKQVAYLNIRIEAMKKLL